MGKERRAVDPIPEEFASCKEAGDFWDTHDTTDYTDAFTDVDFDVAIEGRRFEVDIEEDVMVSLCCEAKKKHLRPGRLASDLLRKELATAGCR